MANIYYSDGMPGGNAWQQQPVYYQQPRSRQQPQTVVLRQPGYSDYSADEDFAAAASKGLGVTQVVCGILGIILGILMLTSCAYGANDAVGIWCGVFIIISGAISIAAANQKSRELIIASLIFSILLCLLFSLGMFLAGAVALGRDEGVKTYVYAWFACSVPNSTSIIWDSILMIFGLLSWICALAQAIICCKSKAVCGVSNNVGAVVTYVHRPQMYPNNGYNMGPRPPFNHPPAEMPQPPEYSQHSPAAPPPAYRPPTAWSESPQGQTTGHPAPAPQGQATAPPSEPPPRY